MLMLAVSVRVCGVCVVACVVGADLLVATVAVVVIALVVSVVANADSNGSVLYATPKHNTHTQPHACLFRTGTKPSTSVEAASMTARWLESSKQRHVTLRDTSPRRADYAPTPLAWARWWRTPCTPTRTCQRRSSRIVHRSRTACSRLCHSTCAWLIREMGTLAAASALPS
jgi:hypothetical protein